jgi:hypothetical protein
MSNRQKYENGKLGRKGSKSPKRNRGGKRTKGKRSKIPQGNSIFKYLK